MDENEMNREVVHEMIHELKRKRAHGGGRKKHVPPLKKRLVTLTEDQAKLVRMWGRGDLSAGGKANLGERSPPEAA